MTFIYSSSITDLTDIHVICSLVETDVRNGVNILHSHFNEMVMLAHDALHASNADPRMIVNFIRLPDVDFNYIPNELWDPLTRAADVIGLFFELNNYWDHFNYQLFEKLINAPGFERLFSSLLRTLCDVLRNGMQHYVREMEHFRNRTAIEVYCKAVPQRRVEVPAGFRELKCELSDVKTLQDIEVFRREKAYKYRMSECLVFWKNIMKGSIIITLWIPAFTQMDMPQKSFALVS